ncbi:MAG: site-specific integrase [Oscillospiraceae bacterium]|nr:site-specific integrase [Oscillospiraceae bacterium]
MDADAFLSGLKTIASVKVQNKIVFVSDRTRSDICDLMRKAYKVGIRWNYAAKNPFVDSPAAPDKAKSPERKIWSTHELRRALQECKNPRLFKALILCLSLSLRIGELCALTWDCIDISPESVAEGTAYAHINKQLIRISVAAYNEIDKKGDIFYQFPSFSARYATGKASRQTMLVLKKLKTGSSERRVYLPKSICMLLQEWKETQEKNKKILGSQYYDYGLVFCHEDGRPITEEVVNKDLKKLCQELGVPPIHFHDIRHSSATVKLRLSNGNVKAVQHELGHSTSSMTLQIYTHNQTEDSQEMAQVFETKFLTSVDLARSLPDLKTQTHQQQV